MSIFLNVTNKNDVLCWQQQDYFIAYKHFSKKMLMFVNKYLVTGVTFLFRTLQMKWKKKLVYDFLRVK